jgi:hypothetical protein
MSVNIRFCTIDDLDALQEIARETFDEIFRSLNTAATMEKYLAEAFDAIAFHRRMGFQESGRHCFTDLTGRGRVLTIRP